MAIVLAGGESRRMGTDKARLQVQGTSLLERTVRITTACLLPTWVVGRAIPSDWPDDVSACYRSDPAPGTGPLGGIVAAMTAADGRACLVLPCDLPGLTCAALEWVLQQWQSGGNGIALLTRCGGHLQPLFAVYGPSAQEDLRGAYAGGERSIQRAIAAVPWREVAVPSEHAWAFQDCDTPDDWRRFQEHRA